ncbi:MAG: phosphate ABC transporter permease PstA [Candidatus Kapabacteria bacterium]|nr:phosphate ABC transporter permease PstA [Ignavibacteriota bacterium]MCW5883823.1 phosphate ABC transporter permease PstA [Candidatus Kapabacteria bacterium]
MNNKISHSDIFIWFTGIALGITLIMIVGMLILIIGNGSDYYVPKQIVSITTNDNQVFLGQIIKFQNSDSKSGTAEIENNHSRVQIRVANRDYYGYDFIWLDMEEILEVDYTPDDAFIVERLEFGNFFGYIEGVLINNHKYEYGSEQFESKFAKYLEYSEKLRNEINQIESNEISSVNFQIDKSRTKIKKLDYEQRLKNVDNSKEIRQLENNIEILNNKYFFYRDITDSLLKISSNYTVLLRAANGYTKSLPLIQVFRAYQPNIMNFWDKIIFAIEKIISFISSEPRESNTEGGIFPAIFGTVLMVMLMSLAAVPLGVLTALYLREYANQVWMVRVVRIAVNNLAGVPSIVFGIFGLGFFIYTVGGTIDQLFFPESLPAPTWGTGGILWASLTLALLTVPVVIVSTEEALESIPLGIREASMALGATKWQTTYRIILPAAAPGIMTGVILAMARGAGEVAPLMITGVVKLAPALPFDWNFPFFHLDRKFMHLGFHIYDVGFQSPNIEAAIPMVYMTTLLLILIVLLLNITAITIRTRLRRKFKGMEEMS